MKYFLLFMSLLFCLVIQSEAQNTSNRSKVGIVLSGGGAKGMAHIGVIKAMEEAGLSPDYITGASMGSIFGALYAIGYTETEMEEITLNIKWEHMLSNDIDLSRVAIEENPYYGRYIIELPIHKGKIGLLQGLIEGQELTMLLNNISRPAHTVNDFHKLAIPFECVAADIEHGESVILRSGFLPEAMRASMSIPTFFTPTLIDSTLFVDGGLLRNFPVQEVIDMGADIVIGIFVGSDLDKKEDLNSMVDVLSQSAFVFSFHDSNEQKKLVDIYIEPNLKDFSTSSFWSAKEIMAQGDKPGQEYLEVFKQLADSLNKLGSVKLPRKPKLIEEYIFETIEISGNHKIPKELILGKLRIAPNDSINITELENRINLLYGTLYFTKVDYVIDAVNKKLVIKVKEAYVGSIKFAAHYDSDNYAGININFTLCNLLLPSSRFIFEYDLAQNPSASLNYFIYMGKKQNVAVMLNGQWIQTQSPSFFGESRVEYAGSISDLAPLLKNNVLISSLNIQSTYKSNSTFGVKINHIENAYAPSVLDSISLNRTQVAFKKLDIKDWGSQLFFTSNTLNKPFFPSSGMFTNFSVNYMFDRKMNFNFASKSIGNVDDASTPPQLLIIRTHVASATKLIEKVTLITQFKVNLTRGRQIYPTNLL